MTFLAHRGRKYERVQWDARSDPHWVVPHHLVPSGGLFWFGMHRRSTVFFCWNLSLLFKGFISFRNEWQRCPEATAHSDFASYSCPMHHLLVQNFMYSAFTSIVNVVIFAAYSSQCAVYFESADKVLEWQADLLHMAKSQQANNGYTMAVSHSGSTKLIETRSQLLTTIITKNSISDLITSKVWLNISNKPNMYAIFHMFSPCIKLKCKNCKKARAMSWNFAK